MDVKTCSLKELVSSIYTSLYGDPYVWAEIFRRVDLLEDNDPDRELIEGVKKPRKTKKKKKTPPLCEDCKNLCATNLESKVKLCASCLRERKKQANLIPPRYSSYYC